MEIELNITYGTYTPSALKLQLNAKGDLGKLWGTKFEDVFIHEYVHFIQDISTLYGLTNFTVSLNDIASRAQSVYSNSKETIIKRPVPFENNSNSKLNRLLLSHYFGNRIEIPIIQADSDWKICSVKEIKNQLHPELETIKIEVENYIFNLGSFHIMEGMAYEVQKFLYPATFKSPDIPYLVISNILKNLDHLDIDSLDLIAICDASLLSFHPAEAFFAIYQNLQNFIEKPEHSWYYELVENGMTNAIDVQNNNVTNRLFSNKVSEFIELIERIIPYPNLVEQKEWLYSKLRKFQNLRQENKTFIIEILNSQNPKHKFHEFIKETGSPVIFNLLGEGYTIEEDILKQDASVYWTAITEIRNILSTTENGCKLINYCKKNLLEGPPDEKCVNSPWNRVNLETHCYFAKFWKSWMLSQYKWD
jgi:hypothetical protein